LAVEQSRHNQPHVFSLVRHSRTTATRSGSPTARPTVAQLGAIFTMHVFIQISGQRGECDIQTMHQLPLASCQFQGCKLASTEHQSN